ncbi:hypothetical protein Ahy_B10g105733 isoform C [Arachis hypogaea]|uniref:EXPERA domain-containing protein n=1 Tax=Arachis hypogaea TaxID=3818 RepID=A0A444X8T4_ARAHY|nr:hypothetical protein Ahy_B10g105733 isoform C [Arachis hypogaea]
MQTLKSWIYRSQLGSLWFLSEIKSFITLSTLRNHLRVPDFVYISSVVLLGRLPKKTKTDRLLMCWWAFTGLTHLIVEGYFVFAPEFYKDKTGFYLAEVWKEYSKGDSRYAGRDAGIVSVEGLTAVFGGPASLLAVYAIATGKSYSHILQFAISLSQLYGVGVYYITALLEGDNFAASKLYYYAYYIGANASWIVIPLIIAIRSWKYTCAAFKGQDQTKKHKVR